MCFVNKCGTCDSRFSKLTLVCGCGEKRKRCGGIVLQGKKTCRSHMSDVDCSVYHALAKQIPAEVLEHIVERDDRDLTVQYAAAQVVLAQILDKPDGEVAPQVKLRMCKEFFEIAKLRKTVEQGEVVNVAFDDKMADKLRQRFKAFLDTLMQALVDEKIPKDTQERILRRVQEAAKISVKYRVHGLDNKPDDVARRTAGMLLPDAATPTKHTH